MTQTTLGALTGSTARVFVGTALLGLVAESGKKLYDEGGLATVVHGHSHPEGGDGHEHAAHAHADHDHGAHVHHNAHDETTPTVRARFAHDPGAFGLILNLLGGAAACAEAYRIATRTDRSSAFTQAVGAGVLATLLHAGTHVAAGGHHARTDVVATVTGPSHRRLLAASMVGAIVGVLAARTS
ncbi:MAG: hypothetical protein U0Q21_14755 [Dermatophilaceae bacterium]